MLTIKFILSKPLMYIRCQKSKISNTFQDFNVVYCIVYSQEPYMQFVGLTYIHVQEILYKSNIISISRKCSKCIAG